MTEFDYLVWVQMVTGQTPGGYTPGTDPLAVMTG